MSRQRSCFEIGKKEEEIKELEQALSAPNFWDNQERAKTVSERLSFLSSTVGDWRELERETAAALETAQEFAHVADEGIEQEIKNQAEELAAKFATAEFLVLFTGAYDSRDAIVSLSAGAGGTDAQDWAEMLLAMLLRFSERKGLKTRLVDKQSGQEAGIKSAAFEAVGQYAYGWLKSEAGVHRLVRISPYDAEKMRHTSFALVDVIPDLGDLPDIELKDEELRIDVFRSSGHGGQSVNTTDSAVRVVHIPTGLTVSCQNERSQQQNKATALKILKSRLALRRAEEREAAERRIRGEVKSAEWGSQIRSYVLHPYKLVKDHRTNFETSDVDAVLSGGLEEFSEAYLKWMIDENKK